MVMKEVTHDMPEFFFAETANKSKQDHEDSDPPAIKRLQEHQQAVLADTQSRRPLHKISRV